jgi:hypothetical protein
MTTTLQIPPASTPVLDRNGYMTQAWRTFFNDLVTRAGGITGGLQAADDTLTGLAEMDTATGLVAETGVDTFAKRTITGAAGRIAVSNGSGAVANPTIDLAAVAGVAGTHSPVNAITVDGFGRITAIS